VSGIYEWISEQEMVRGDRAYFVCQYDRRIRKTPALVCSDGNSQHPLAYFRSEADARQFAADVLGGSHDL
jgi:hypothetical protein